MSTTYTESEVEQKIHARLTEIVEKAHAEADKRGYCTEFDSIAELAGLPKRSSVFRVTIPVTVEVSAPASSGATSSAAQPWRSSRRTARCPGRRARGVPSSSSNRVGLRPPLSGVGRAFPCPVRTHRRART
jgi:hypothetical protein